MPEASPLVFTWRGFALSCTTIDAIWVCYTALQRHLISNEVLHGLSQPYRSILRPCVTRFVPNASLLEKSQLSFRRFPLSSYPVTFPWRGVPLVHSHIIGLNYHWHVTRRVFFLTGGSHLLQHISETHESEEINNKLKAKINGGCLAGLPTVSYKLDGQEAIYSAPTCAGAAAGVTIVTTLCGNLSSLPFPFTPIGTTGRLLSIARPLSIYT